MNTLVIGGTGFIGEAFANTLHDHNDEKKTFFLSLYPFRHTTALPSRCSFLEGSWRSCDYLKTIRDHQISKIIFLAHGSHPRSSCDDTVADFQKNTVAVMRALGEIANVGGQHVIFASSNGAVDFSTFNPHLQLETGYALGKVMAEAYLALLAKHRHLSYDIVRIPNPFGPFQIGGNGQGIVPIFVDNFVRLRPIEFIGDYQRQKQYLFVDAVSNQLLRLMKNDSGSNCVHSIEGAVSLSAVQMADCVHHSVQKKGVPTLGRARLGFPCGNHAVETPAQFREHLDLTIDWLLSTYYPDVVGTQQNGSAT